MLPITICPEACYSTKSNIAFPGTQAQATAAETLADTVVDFALGSEGVDNVSMNIGAGSIEVAT
jgi:hypothetical protein